jgi:uncharacterized cupin superfamily protein
MSESEQRHRNVVNEDEVDAREMTQGTKFGSKITGLARAAGSESLGCNLFEVEPGRAAFPCHYHCAIEEGIYVLEGGGTLRIGEERVELRSGDYVTLLAGPDHAHQVINTGDVPLRYLCISSRARADVVGYPDSNKVLASASPTNDFFDPPWVRAIFMADQTVGYYDGEDVG